MSTKPAAILYAAKSTDDRHGSIPTQLADARKFAEAQGWAVVGEFSDEGFSAYKGNRGPGLERAKRAAIDAAAERGTEAMLVVQHSDRLARGAGDAPGAADHLGEVFFTMRRQSVRLRSVQDDSNLEDVIRVALIGERNTEDSKRKAEATAAGKRRRFDRGDSAGPLPFGYRLVNDTDGDGNVKTDGDRLIRSRVPDPDESPVVLEMFRLLDRGYGIGDITRWLNAQGVRTKRGNYFGRSRVREILRNPWYGGKVQGYGELRDGNHEPILPWEEFQRITAKLTRHDPVSATKRQGGRPSEVALLSRVLVCHHCGGGLWHRKSGSKRYYVCGNVRHATGACEARKFDALRAERAVAAHLDSIFVDFAAWLEQLTQQRANQRDGLVRELATVHDRAASLDRDEALVRADYMRQLRAGKETAAELAASELERIVADRAELDALLADLEARLAEWEEEPNADVVLDWWNEFSAAIRGDVVGSESVRDANTALREHFAAILVTCGNTPTTGRATFDVRFDFILKDAEALLAEGAPMKPFWLHLGVDGADQLRGTPPGVETDRLTFVYDHPVIAPISL